MLLVDGQEGLQYFDKAALDVMPAAKKLLESAEVLPAFNHAVRCFVIPKYHKTRYSVCLSFWETYTLDDLPTGPRQRIPRPRNCLQLGSMSVAPPSSA
jgi:hypothetical protein